MRIGVYAVCYNEEFLLPYFLRHYQSFASSITIFDNFSTDNSVSLCKKAGVKVYQYSTEGNFHIAFNTQIKNECWKGSDFDWVIVIDLDEFLYHPNIIQYLENQSASILIPQGYDMVSWYLPTTQKQIYDEVKTGVPSRLYCKWCIFRPIIKEINYSAGAHKARPSPGIQGQPSELKLLHFKYLELNWLIERTKQRKERIHPMNLQKGWCGHYFKSLNEITAHYASLLKHSLKII